MSVSKLQVKISKASKMAYNTHHQRDILDTEGWKLGGTSMMIKPVLMGGQNHNGYGPIEKGT